jgi:O-methyltransferase
MFDEGTIISKAKGRSILNPQAFDNLIRCCKSVSTLEGNLAEIGTFNGGSTYLIAGLLPHKTLYAYDTFSGLPEPTIHDNYHKQGEFCANYDDVNGFLSELSNVKLIQSTFPDKSNIIENEKFCLVHIDVDLYQPYKDCLNFFYPRMVKGGVIILDDYDGGGCAGAKKASDEFMSDKPQTIIRTGGFGYFTI